MFTKRSSLNTVKVVIFKSTFFYVQNYAWLKNMHAITEYNTIILNIYNYIRVGEIYVLIT